MIGLERRKVDNISLKNGLERKVNGAIKGLGRRA